MYIYWGYLIVQPLQEKIRIICMGESTTRPMGFIIYIFSDERWYSDTEILGGVVKVQAAVMAAYGKMQTNCEFFKTG